MQQDFPDSGVDREFPITLPEHSRTPWLAILERGKTSAE